MTATQQTTSGEGWFSKLVVVLLLAVAIGLYLRIVMVDEGRGDGESAPRASVRVVEGSAPVAAGAGVVAQPQELPEDQMALIRRVFAPELLNE